MRVRWSEHEARSAISAWRKSGLSVEKFATERGLVPQRIYRWRKKLEVPAKAAAKPAPSMSLLPVQVTATRARGEPVAVFLRTGHNGYVIYFKRLERGRFQLPVIDASRTRVEMEPAQLAMLLDGIDLNAKRLVRWKPESQGIDTPPSV